MLRHLTTPIDLFKSCVVWSRNYPFFQEEYYANGHKVMQELYRDLWGWVSGNIALIAFHSIS